MVVFKNNKLNLEYFLIMVLIVLLPFENSILQSTPLGMFGASLSVIPIALIFFLRIVKNKIEKEFLIFFLYSTFVFFASFLVFTYLGYGQDITIIQPLKNYILYLTWFYVFFLFKNYKSVDCFVKPIKYLFVLTLIIIFFSVIFGDFINSINFLNYESPRNSRPRGFSFEASTFGFLVSVVFILYIWISSRKLFIYIPLLILCLLLIQSKGSLTAILFTILLTSMVLIKKNFLVNVIYVFLFFVIYQMVSDSLYLWFLYDIEEFTSIATRLSLFCLGLMALIISPLGWGFSGYYPHFYLNLEKVILFLSENIEIKLNFTELSSYTVVGNFTNVGTKSFFMDCLIVYGFPFLLISIFYFYKIFRYSVRNNDYHRMLVLIFLLIALIFYNSSFGMYIGACALGLVFNTQFMKKG